MDVTVLISIAAVVLVVLGVVGTVLPALPGPALILGGFVLLAWADGFVRVGGDIIAILAVLTVGTYAVDFAATGFGAKRLGASRRAVAGAVIGTVVGIFFGLPRPHRRSLPGRRPGRIFGSPRLPASRARWPGCLDRDGGRHGREAGARVRDAGRLPGRLPVLIWTHGSSPHRRAIAARWLVSLVLATPGCVGPGDGSRSG